MQLVRSDKKVKFSALAGGECFLWMGGFYKKMSNGIDLKNEDRKFTAFNLGCNCVSAIGPDDEVARIKGKFVEDPK